MFEINSKKVNYQKDNYIIQKNLSLDEDLDCFFVVSCDNKNFWELVTNNIVEYIIDRISITNTYKDFSTALENINGFIKTWKQDTEKEVQLDIFISILNKNTLIFSNIWKASCYLLNKDSELIEITDKDTQKTHFDFISNGELKDEDFIIFSNINLLKHLSKSDILDGITSENSVKIFNENIQGILSKEILTHNTYVTSLKYQTYKNQTKQNPHVAMIQEKYMDLLDNTYIKKALASLLMLKDKCHIQSRHATNWIFLVGISIALFLLYTTLSGIINVSSENEEKEIAKNNIVVAKNFVRIASENIGNTQAFENNISQAEQAISEIEQQQVFLNDISKLHDDINVLKKQFNKIETFISGSNNELYSGELKNALKIIKSNYKPYIITKKWVIGPILWKSWAQNYLFTSLEENEYFVDATSIGNNLYILTNTSKIVRFTSNGYFSFMDVSGQQTWEKSKQISTYAQNIYLLGAGDSQIYKHTLWAKSFSKATPYLNNEDLAQIWNIESIGIDGWFYILKEDLSVVKFYSSPTYRLEKIVLNKLPKNYNKEEGSKIELKATQNSNYVYMLLNNKIWVFEANTKRYQDTKSLTYVWQIEWEKEEILDFNIENDRILTVLNTQGLYKLEFEISDGKLLLR